MNISTMTGMFAKRRHSKEFISVFESIEYCKEAGFDTLDLSLTALFRDESEFNAENWRELAVALREEADKIGVSFCQSHLPFRPMKLAMNHGTEEEERFLESMIDRALEVSAIAGVEWAVVHPVCAIGVSCENTDAHIKANHQTYGKLIEKANALGVGIVFENVTDKQKRRFGSMASELVSLVDSFKNESIGICWDFGHGAIMYENQVDGIKQVGNRLKAVHVADNWGINDDHLPPFFGNNNWEEIMGTLREIGFDGNMVFEVRINGNMPDELKHISAVYCAELGKYLISL